MSQSYSRIVKSSAITGGSAIFSMLIGLVSTKGLSLILGPAGIGELRLFQSVLSTSGYIAGLGTGSSAVRDIAAADGAGDREEVQRLAWLYRRLAVVYGLFGALALAFLAVPISRWVFDDGARAGSIAWLGIALFFSALQAGQVVPLQALQRIGLAAKVSVLAAAWSAAFTIGIMWWRGIDGAALALGGSALGGFMLARWLVSRAALVGTVTHRFSVQTAAAWCRLGIATMAVDAIASVVMIATSAAVVHRLGMESNGLYLAAWGLSGTFASLVLGAMGGDLYPRLSAVRGDGAATSRLVGEQIEISVLLALPGLLLMLGLAPLVVRILYSHEFAGAAVLLLWFVPFAFCRVLITPISFALLASGRGGSMVVIQATCLVAQLVMAVVGLNWRGLVGMAEGTCAAGLLGVIVFSLGARREVGLRWSAAASRIALAGGAVIAVCVAAASLAPDEVWRYLVFGAVSLLASVVACRGVVRRLDGDHRLVRYVRSIPLLRSVAGPR
jgi:antigen flippase